MENLQNSPHIVDLHQTKDHQTPIYPQEIQTPAKTKINNYHKLMKSANGSLKFPTMAMVLQQQTHSSIDSTVMELKIQREGRSFLAVLQ